MGITSTVASVPPVNMCFPASRVLNETQQLYMYIYIYLCQQNEMYVSSVLRLPQLLSASHTAEVQYNR